MSITKRLSVKAAKPQDQILASKVQALIEATLADQTTGLSNAIDQAVMDSVMYGSGSTVAYKASGRYQFGWSDPRAGVHQLSIKDMPMPAIEHFAHDMTTEQLRAAWTLAYGDRAVSTSTLADDPDMLCIGQTLYQRGQLIEQRRLETYSHCYALKPNADH